MTRDDLLRQARHDLAKWLTDFTLIVQKPDQTEEVLSRAQAAFGGYVLLYVEAAYEEGRADRKAAEG